MRIHHFGAVAALAAFWDSSAGCSKPAAPVDSARLADAANEPGQWLMDGRTYTRSATARSRASTNPMSRNWAWPGMPNSTPIAASKPRRCSSMACCTTSAPGTSPAPTTRGPASCCGPTTREVPREWGRYACCEPVARGLAFWKGKAIIATLDGRLIALDAKTGKPVWTATTFDKSQPWSITGAPRVFDGMVVVGNGGADLGVRGFVSAWNADTGKFLWKFYLVPGDPSKGPDGAASDSVMEMAAKTWTGEWWKWGGGGTAWEKHGSLKKLFMLNYNVDDVNIKNALSHFSNSFLNEIKKNYEISPGIKFMFSLPEKGSACKRMNLFLRWMVRKDELDFGIWNEVQTCKLIIPVDTHVARICRSLNLTKRKNVSWKMAEEITKKLKRYDPIDPVKYDFAICHIGMRKMDFNNI